MNEHQSSSPEAARTKRDAESRPETRRVQVVARWNNWARVRDPIDGSERWIDLDRANYQRA